jgi:hypothetical protein
VQLRREFGEGLAAAQGFAELSEVKDIFRLLTVSSFTMTSAAPSVVWTKIVGEAAILGD